MPDYYHSITTLHALQNAWRAVRAKNAAGGIDGFTLSHFEKRLNYNMNLFPKHGIPNLTYE